MHNPLHAILWHIVVVEERVRYARDAEEQEAACGEEEGAEVGSLGRLGYGGVKGEEGCILDRLVVCLVFLSREEERLTTVLAMRLESPLRSELPIKDEPWMYVIVRLVVDRRVWRSRIILVAASLRDLVLLLSLSSLLEGHVYRE